MLEFVSENPFRVVGKVQGFVTTERWFNGIWLGKSWLSGYVVMRENSLVVREMDRDLKAERLTRCACFRSREPRRAPEAVGS